MRQSSRFAFLAIFQSLAMLAMGQPNLQWQKCLGGFGVEFAKCVQQTTDGGYIVAGETGSNNGDVSGNHGGGDCWIVRLDSTGTIEWQRCLGGFGTDAASYIEQTSDGGYIVAGYSFSNDGDVSGNHGAQDVWVGKLTSVGSLQWQKSLGGSATDLAYCIRQTVDGGYIVAGRTFSNDGDVSGIHPGSGDAWIIKLDDMGSTEWQKCLGGGGDELAESVAPTTDGGYILAGGTLGSDNTGDVSGNHGGGDGWVVKLDSAGSLQWQKCLGGSASDHLHSLQQTIDGGYIVSGATSSNDGDVSGNHGGGDGWVVKMDNGGTLQWQQCLGGVGSERAESIHQSSDGSYVVAGNTGSQDGDVSGNHGALDMWVVELDAIGNIEWQKCLGGSSAEIGTSLAQTNDGTYIVAGYTDSNDGDVSGNLGEEDMWVVKLGYGEVGVPEPPSRQFSIAPNPVSSLLTITYLQQAQLNSIKLTDAIGRNVLKKQFTSLNSTITLDLGGYQSGLYLLQLRQADGTETSIRVVKE